MVNVSPAPLCQRRVTRVPFSSFFVSFLVFNGRGEDEVKSKGIRAI